MQYGAVAAWVAFGAVWAKVWFSVHYQQRLVAVMVKAEG